MKKIFVWASQQNPTPQQISFLINEIAKDTEAEVLFGENIAPQMFVPWLHPEAKENSVIRFANKLCELQKKGNVIIVEPYMQHVFLIDLLLAIKESGIEILFISQSSNYTKRFILHPKTHKQTK